jgi:glycosyltransferase involved in cell wall biosynthesis
LLVSILIANYNNSRFLENALKSVSEQGYSNWEIILVDDGSTDNFEEIVAGYNQDEHFKIYRNGKNFGCGYTKRKCAEMANGDLLAFLDPDDALVSVAIEMMVEAHKLHPECSLIHSTHYICDERMTVKRIAEYPGQLSQGVPYLLQSDGSIHHFASFKRSAYLQTVGISPYNSKAVDQDLYYKLEEVGQIMYIDTPLYYYRIHSGAISTSGNEKLATIVHYRIIEEACLRRINDLKTGKPPEAKQMISTYRIRYRKVRIMRLFREQKYFRFLTGIFEFPFRGGLGTMVRYSKKLSREGMNLLRRSFVDSYQIKP